MNEEIEKKLDILMDKKEDLIWELVDIQMEIAKLYKEDEQKTN